MIQVFGANSPVDSLGPADFQRYRPSFKDDKSLESIKGAICKTKAFFNWAGPGINGQGYIDRLPRFGDASNHPPVRPWSATGGNRGTCFHGRADSALLAAAGPKLRR